MSHIPQYPTDADYQTNAPSYSDHIARHEQLMKYLANRVWEYDKELALRIAAWDKNLEEFDQEVMNLLREWIDDGTFAQIINEEIFAMKLDRSEFDAHVLQVTGSISTLTAAIALRVKTSDLPYINVKVLKDTEGLTYTAAMQKALDVAKTAGGVHVILPAGEEVVLTAELKVYSNTTIEAEPGVEFVRQHPGYMLMTGNRQSEADRKSVV